MPTRTRPTGRSRSSTPAATGEARPEDALLNSQIGEALRRGAEARTARAEASAIAEALENATTHAAVRALIDGRRR